MTGLVARFHPALSAVAPAQWDALRPDDNPFVSHAFLAGLEETGCIDARAGWQPHHLTLHDNGRLVAAAPLYRKTNSHGEFVFDWSWAHAYAEHGYDYYPKLLCAVPYSPVTGPRLLAGAGDRVEMRARLIAAMRDEAIHLGLSSAHVNFPAAYDESAFIGSDWLERFDWQFHWHNRGWADFDEFLASLNHRKRKNIRQERAHVATAGIHCEIRHGDELEESEWCTLHDFYRSTFEERGNFPALTLDFFRHLGTAMPRSVVAVLCRRGNAAVAGALMLRSSTTLYGRYWGSRENVPGLHFEACYYQGIEYCLREGLTIFEPGAQGEHKIARGFLPARTRSFHWIADARFRRAIASALQREAIALDAYRDECMEHSPFAKGHGNAT